MAKYARERNVMPAIDPTTNIGKLRLRLGDWKCVTWLPDTVYQQTLVDCNNNLTKAAGLLAQYILAILAQGTRSKMGILESYDDQAFTQYRQFIIDTVSNPAIMNISPLAIVTGAGEPNPLIEFSDLWNAGYITTTSTQDMQLYAGKPVESYTD